MNKVVSLFFLISLLTSCTNKIYYSTDWQNDKVSADGIIPAWSDPLRFYDEKTGINYTISNDRLNLYLFCSISEELLQTKILRSGLEFGIDTLEKKSFLISIKFPVNNKSNPELKKDASPQPDAGLKERSERSSFKLKLIDESKEMQLAGFKPPLGGIISLSSPENAGISVSINIDKKNIMHYEVIIPFSTFYKKELVPSDSNRVFNFRIKIDRLSKSDISASGNEVIRGGVTEAGGMRGGGMRGGGMRGGGMRGGGTGGGGMRGGSMNGGEIPGGFGENGSQRNTSLAGTTKTTMKLKLAYR